MWVRWWFSAGKRESWLLCESGYQRTQMNSKKKPTMESGQRLKSSNSDSCYWFTQK
jgi:hypothetical protein